MLLLLCVVGAAPARFFAPTPFQPAALRPAIPRTPAAVADLGRVEREALMQQLGAQLESAVERLESEAQQTNAIQHFFAVLATGVAFFVAYIATTMEAKKTGQVYGIPNLRSARASVPPRMSEEWGEEDYAELWSTLRSESENTRSKVRSGSPDAVLGHARAVYVVIFNEGTENEGVYTLQSQDDPRRTHLLTFEHTEDADRFASLLQGQGLNELGRASMWDATKTVEYCNSCEYAVTHVPVGTMFTPPRNNSIDEEAFRVRRDLIRQSESSHFGDGQPVDSGMLGLDMYQSEREMLERLFGGYSP